LVFWFSRFVSARVANGMEANPATVAFFKNFLRDVLLVIVKKLNYNLED
jgi:hypothetical protein